MFTLLVFRLIATRTHEDVYRLKLYIIFYNIDYEIERAFFKKINKICDKFRTSFVSF